MNLDKLKRAQVSSIITSEPCSERREHINTFAITTTHYLISLDPGIPGYEGFLGSHLFCGQRKAVIDVGPTAAVPSLLKSLYDLGVKPSEIDYVILTHVHGDHAGGTGAALKAMTKAKVIAHEKGRPHLIDPTKLWEASRKTLGDNVVLKYGKYDPVPADRIVVATDGMKLDLGNDLVLEIYLTPGHASHHLSIFQRKSGVLVAGETAGTCVEGRGIRLATPPPFRLKEGLASIDRLIALQPSRLCYGHFGCYDGAMERLNYIRNKTLEWHEIVGQEVKEDKNPEEILEVLRKKDRSLDYLNTLSKDTFIREHGHLINSVTGLVESHRSQPKPA